MTANRDNSELIETYHSQAKAKKLSGDTQGAVDDYIKIIKLKPDDVVAYNNIGNIYFSNGYYFQARTMYDIAVNINPEFEIAVKNKKKCEDKTNLAKPSGFENFEKATKALKDLTLITEVFSILEIFTKYAKDLNEKHKNDDKFVPIWFLFVEKNFISDLIREVDDCYRNNDLENIPQYLNLILKHNPQHYEANCLKIRIECRQGNVEQALKDYEKVLSSIEDYNKEIMSSDLSELKGDILYAQKDYLKAFEAYKKANDDALFQDDQCCEKIGICSYYINDYECAIKNFIKAESSYERLNTGKEYLNKIFNEFIVNNKFPEYLYRNDLSKLTPYLDTENLEYILDNFNKNGKYEIAFQIINEVINNDENDEDYYYYLKGKLLYENNYFAEALDEFDNAIYINENNAEYFYYRGLTYNALDDFESTKENILYAITLSNNDNKYQAALDSMSKENEFLNLSTCSEKRFSKFTGLSEAKVKKFIEARNNGKKYYDFTTFSNDLDLMPHEIVTLENRIIFNTKPKNKIGRKIDW